MVEPHRVYAETISGTIPAMERPVFAGVVFKLERGDVLVVAKLDRLGRNASDMDRTVEHLGDKGVRVVVLDLPVMEVTSAAGDLVRRMFAAFAQFERDQLLERTRAGLKRAKKEGTGPQGCACGTRREARHSIRGAGSRDTREAN